MAEGILKVEVVLEEQSKIYIENLIKRMMGKSERAFELLEEFANPDNWYKTNSSYKWDGKAVEDKDFRDDPQKYIREFLDSIGGDE